jgi:hypothetical protein
MKIILLSLLVTLTILIIPTVYAESYDEWKSNRDGGNASFSTNEERFEALSSWASDNKDELGKDISFYVENISPVKADFTVSNVSLIPDENLNYILSFDTTIKLKSEVRYPTEFVMDGRSLTILSDGSKAYGTVWDNPSCEFTGATFNSESGDTGTFHSCFGITKVDPDLLDWEKQGVAIYMDYYNTGLQPISVIPVVDIQNTVDMTISAQSWFDGIFNFFKSLFV